MPHLFQSVGFVVRFIFREKHDGKPTCDQQQGTPTQQANGQNRCCVAGVRGGRPVPHGADPAKLAGGTPASLSPPATCGHAQTSQPPVPQRSALVTAGTPRGGGRHTMGATIQRKAQASRGLPGPGNIPHRRKPARLAQTQPPSTPSTRPFHF